MANRILHRIAHWFGWNRRTVETWADEQGVVWIGFGCATCGRLSGVASIGERISPKELRRG